MYATLCNITLYSKVELCDASLSFKAYSIRACYDSLSSNLLLNSRAFGRVGGGGGGGGGGGRVPPKAN